MKIKKIYENDIEYNIGDYIIIKDNRIETKLYSIPYKNYALIIDKIDDDGFLRYDYKFYDLIKNKFENTSSTFIFKPDILRKMTKKEIEDLNIKIISNKYNL